MQRRWLTLGALVATALGSASCGGPEPVVAPQWNNHATFVSSQAGESVIVSAGAFAATGHKGWGQMYAYLRRHSLQTGALLASSGDYFGDAFRGSPDDTGTWRCEPALPGRLWCVGGPFPGGVHVLDAESLQTVAVQSQMLRAPELAGEPDLSSLRVDPQTRGLVFESRDGYLWIIDPTTLAPARFAGTMSSIPWEGRDGFEQERAPVIGDDTYFFDGETSRKTLERRPKGAGSGTPLHPEHTYLRGAFVKSRNAVCCDHTELLDTPILLDDPPRLLVVEDVVDHGPTLWSVLADGTTQWKVTDLRGARLVGDVLDAKPYGDTVVLVTKTMLLAIRTQDGAVVWTSQP